jgi:hypothetical protein
MNGHDKNEGCWFGKGTAFSRATKVTTLQRLQPLREAVSATPEFLVKWVPHFSAILREVGLPPHLQALASLMPLGGAALQRCDTAHDSKWLQPPRESVRA